MRSLIPEQISLADLGWEVGNTDDFECHIVYKSQAIISGNTKVKKEETLFSFDGVFCLLF